MGDRIMFKLVPLINSWGLERMGVPGLTLYRDSYGFINIGQLLHNYPALYGLLRNRIASAEGLTRQEIHRRNRGYGLLPGGYALEVRPDFVIYPRCCHTLAYFDQWIRAANLPIGGVTWIWMGHPEIRISAIKASAFEISDADNEFGSEWTPQFEPFRVPREEFQAAVATAESCLLELQRIAPPIIDIMIRSETRRIL
jgi:hypothetical protein